MKSQNYPCKLFLFMMVVFFLPLVVLSQTDCRPYVPIEEGSTWEITNYSPKGKESGKVSYKLVKKEISGNDAIFTINAITYNDKDAEVFESTYEAKCVNGMFQFDMACKIDGSAMQAYQAMDIEVDATDFDIPSFDAPAGSQLNEGSVSVSVGSGGVTMFKMTVRVFNRTIDAIEDKTTPAGTFKCIKLSQDVSTQMIFAIQASSVEWYAEGIGLVRSESYNKKGKLTGYSELTQLITP